MNNKLPPDIRNREKIAQELDKSFFVEAGAGSGKTHSLVDRMTGLILTGEAGIENMSAVTFTRKAAAELRERFQIRLEKMADDPKTPKKENERVKAALMNMDRVFIGTIHSFCGRILRERSVEAGIDPGFEEIEEEENLVCALRSWNEYLEKESLAGNSMITWMREHGVSTSHLEKAFLKRVAYADVAAVLGDVPDPDFTSDKEYVRKYLKKTRKYVPDKEPEGGWDKLQSMVIRGTRLVDMGFLEENRKFIHLLKLMDKKAGVKSTVWDGMEKEDVSRILEDFEKFQEEIVSRALREWAEYLHKPLMGFIEGGVKAYRVWREENSILNYQDLLTLTASMLREHPEVRAYFRKKITHLLVDEFQDTDPIQAEMVMLLVGEDPLEKDWRKLRPKPGALFVVGDPKQSIYRFRRADIDIYNLVKDIFKNGGGEILELTANFRSLHPVGELADKAFTPVFPETENKHQAKFAPLNTMRDSSSGFDSGIFRNPIPRVSRHAAGRIAEAEARNIACWIKEALGGAIKLERTDEETHEGLTSNPVPGDFMILTKKKARLGVYARALEELRIPYEISGGESFGESRELREIHKVLKCVSEPSEPVMLIAVLRGAFFGISDNELYEFRKKGGEFSYLTDVLEGCEAVSEAYDVLRRLRKISMECSAATAAEKIVEELGVLPMAASSEMGSTRAGNILKALEMIREHRAEHTGSFADMADLLESYLETKSKEEMGLFPGSVNAVRIMNLHKAKGLEAPVVFLADPFGGGKEHEPDTHICRTGDVSEGYFVIGKKKNIHNPEMEKIAVPPDWEERAREETEYGRAEKQRLEYVAVTRAKNILCVGFYTGDTKKTERAWGIVEPYLADAPFIEFEGKDAGKRESYSITKEKWEKETRPIENIADRVREMSFECTSVTRQAKGDEAFDTGVAGLGGGKGWGNVVHRSLEACGQGKRDKLELMASNWMAEEEVSTESMGDLLALVDSIMESDMWKKLMASEEKYFEMPFSALDGNTILTGAIDLVFKDEGEWVIVDYKTDNFEKDPARKKAYQRQLDIYAKHWEKITGEKVKEARLYRTSLKPS